MVSPSIDQGPIGDVHCLNCGRALAEVVRNQDDGKLYLRPTSNQSNVQVIVAGRRLLRCRRCGGRAFVEVHEDAPVEQIGPQRAAARPAPAVPQRPQAAAQRTRGWRVSSPERGRSRGLSRSAG
jgi:DNA-directed RNA polymerase subunit RPC12/RpoP